MAATAAFPTLSYQPLTSRLAMQRPFVAEVSMVADRALFWAELGLVARPAVLGRVGEVLGRCAAEDAELGAALRLAASHVQSNCLVWPHTSAAETLQLDGPVEPTHWVHSISEGYHSYGAASDSDDDSWSREDEIKVLQADSTASHDRSLGNLCCLGLVALSIALSIVKGVATAMVPSFYPMDRYFLIKASLPGWVHSIYLVKETCLELLHIPIVIGTYRFFRCEIMARFFAGKLDAFSGDEASHEVKIAAAQAGVMSALILFKAIEVDAHPIYTDDNTFTPLQYLHFVSIANFAAITWFAGIAFLLARKLTVRSLIDFRETLTTCEHLDWVRVTKDYQEMFDSVKLLWEPFSLAMTFTFIYMVANITYGTSAAYIWKDPTQTMLAFFHVAVSSVLLVVMLLALSEANSLCVSKRAESMSIAFLAARHYGKVPFHQRRDHQHFMDCINQIPCAVGVFGAMVTKSVAFMVARIELAVIPLAYGLAVRMAGTA
eukprot:TRINITY_DN1765_c0_g1_i1.p1 TRINITY_DN1765_c0_g1~~TRINITY_DN1765_c0_g1_i1.p1  ORF type:complete len:491 (-),score=59.52 TRINITY_DN1765_c0_g1_i1:59-1531(-)